MITKRTRAQHPVWISKAKNTLDEWFARCKCTRWKLAMPSSALNFEQFKAMAIREHEAHLAREPALGFRHSRARAGKVLDIDSIKSSVKGGYVGAKQVAVLVREVTRLRQLLCDILNAMGERRPRFAEDAHGLVMEIEYLRDIVAKGG